MEIDSSSPEYLCELRKFPVSNFFDIEDPRVDIIISHQSTKESFPLYEWIFNDKIYSSTSKIKSRIAIVCRFIHNCRAKMLNQQRRVAVISKNHPVSIADYQDADVIIARIIQMHEYSREYHELKNKQLIHDKSQLQKYNPFWDDRKQLMRCGGRNKEAPISNNMRFPIIIAKCHYSRLLISETHRFNLHCGIRSTIANFNLRYWMYNLQQTARQAVFKCIPCYRCKPRLESQMTGDLPQSRVTLTSPFYETGVDYAGPFEIKSSLLRKAPRIKAYIAVFVCMATNAVHLEVVTSQSADAFKAAFHRFTSRRGLVKVLHSDNAGNFVGTANEQREFHKALVSYESDFKEFFAQRHVEYKTIPPRSPHFGGLWESKMKLVKRHLYPSIGKSVLTYEELNTICHRIEAVLNSRPLLYIDSDPNDPQPLTPGHFLIGRPLLSLPEPDLTNEKISDMQRYRRMMQIFQHFNRRWLKEILPQLQARTKNFRRTSDFKVGQVVLMCDENAPPMYWPLATISRIIPGKDNLVRVVELRTAGGRTFTQSIAKIATLPIADNATDQHSSGGECHGASQDI